VSFAGEFQSTIVREDQGTRRTINRRGERRQVAVEGKAKRG